ncbi:MAG: hypothetical protein A3H91_00055 [Gammaproteobacteria bacterium RIFCSPLOWO2_02_FULL_61_13]|nr:MAG: hypothetical protein A3H91_00055 [Gammaproteobacteria bacterium RIFCSPLOWO2_02_FULL_61_13]
MPDIKSTIFTIGHSTHPIEAFVDLLRRHGVTALADVRSAPYSRFNPQFNREALEQALDANGIKYVFLGRELGARPADPALYKDGEVQYDRIAQSELFAAGIERVVRGAGEFTIALMCAEKEPGECHRTILISPALALRGLMVRHILADGSLEDHEAVMKRLGRTEEFPQRDLFGSG